MITNADYPSPPWTLAGDALIAVRSVAAEVARTFVPRELRLVQVVPGRTIAMLALIRYGAGSTLQYHELIVAPAIVRLGWRVGAWISHICVDSKPSMLAGREIWGLPKQIAAFSWDADAAVAESNEMRVRAQAGRSELAARMPLFGPIFGSDAQLLKWSLARGLGSLRRVPGTLEVSGGHLDALGLDRVRALYRLENFNLTMGAPRFKFARRARRR